MPTPDRPVPPTLDDRRVVIITGCTGPVGRAAAATFAADGHALALVGRDAVRLAGLAEDLRLEATDHLTVVADLRSEAGARTMTQAVVERFGRIDVLLHLVGGFAGGTSIVDLEPAVMSDMLERHVWSTFHVARAVVPLMSERGWGRILAVTSTTTAAPGPRLAAYVAAKSGQEALLRVLAREVAGRGITVNLLAVKAVDADHERETAPSPKTAGWTTPEEIVAVMRQLCSDDAAAVNGARIPLDGRA